MKKITLIFILLFRFQNEGYSQICFDTEIIVPISDAGQGFVSSDFNNDGIPDLAVSLGYIDRVEVLKGDGTGNFNSVALLPAYFAPEAVTSGDFNGDGKKDVAAANGMHTASIFYGNGNFNFSAYTPPSIATGWSPLWITNDDFNGDGKKDFVTSNAQSDNVSVLLSNGNSYNGPILYNVGISPQYVAAADFNSDGKPDIIAANTGSNNLTVLFGNGQGTFTQTSNFTTAINPNSITLSDFNNDGKIDIATSNCGPNTGTTSVSVLLNNGLGIFNTSVEYFIGTYPYSITSADFNGDGNIDLAVAVSFLNKIAILLGNGLGGFGPAIYFPFASGPIIIITDDFNLDGKADIAINSGYYISILLNTTPFIKLTPSANPICAEQTTTIVATGCTNYTWSSASNNSIIIVSPLTSTTYSICGTTTAGCFNSSNISIIVSNCVGLNELSLESQSVFKVSPNPSNNNFEFETNYTTDLILFDELGRQIFSFSLNEQNNYKKTIQNLDSGIYFILDTAAKKKRITKIISSP